MVNPEVHRRASLYAESTRIAIDSAPFDGGEDGSVWHTDQHSVVKSFERYDNYRHELECYKRLKAAGLSKKIRAFNVPEFLGNSDELWVIEMGIVFPPYILDFGKAYLADPGWPEHVLAEWNDKMAFWWGSDARIVRLALYDLRTAGIWYYDAKPGNVMLENWNPSLDDD
ncbi:MAG: hypothetical protein WD872_01760 [Pirellulaceae bacterium]